MSLDNAENQLQNALITTYLANLAFLSEYDNKLYNRIVGLSDSIDRGEYKERYFIEFIEEVGDFDIYDEKHNVYLYDKNPKKYNNKAKDAVSFDSKGEFHTLERWLFLKYHFDDELNYKDINIDSFSESRRFVIEDLNEYMDIFDEDFSEIENRKYKEINKFIFIGTLLGRHILRIVKKVKAQHFFVCENNLEIFRLSLFVFDYTLLVENDNTVVFSIMEEESELNEHFRTFFKNKPHFNANIKYYSTNYHVDSYFDWIFNGLISASPLSFDYNMMLHNVAKLGYERINNYRVISALKKLKNNYLEDNPVVFVGAGPSLDDTLEWIKENQNNLIIVAVGASYKKLISEGIRVDILTTLDPSYKLLEDKQFDDESVSKLKDTFIIASMNTNDKILKKFNRENLFLFSTMYPFFEDNKIQSGYSIGEVTVMLLLDLGVKNLYLVGLDFALNQETGSTHIKESASCSATHSLEDIISSFDKSGYSVEEDVIPVKGNFHDEVYSTRMFYISAISLSNSITPFVKDVNIYNLSKHGAYIEGVDFKDIKDIKLKEMESISNIFEDLKNFLVEKSRDKLSVSENEHIEKEMKLVKSFKESINKIDAFKINSFKEFHENYIDIFEELFNNEGRVNIYKNSVFRQYYEVMMAYTFFCFNQKGLKKESVKIQKVQEVLKSQINRLADYYLKYIEKVV